MGERPDRALPPPPAPGTGLESGDGVDRFARTWSRALRGATYLPMPPVERAAFFLGLSRRLAAAVRGRADSGSRPEGGAGVDVGAVQSVGAALVDAHYTMPEVLGRTVSTLTNRFPLDLNLADRKRLQTVIEELCTGYTRALRERTLDQQDSLRRAAQIAQARTERALRASEQRLRRAALYDAVTGLPNRALLSQRLTDLRAVGPAKARFGLCLLGIDRFTTVNDSLGYAQGDRVLREFANRLRRFATEVGAWAAHLGGDEFALLMPGTAGPEDAGKITDRALAVLAEPLDLDGSPLPLTASAGVVERAYGDADADPADVLRSAAITLHWAKADGAGGWCLFDTERNERDVSKYRLSASMPAALANGEFVLRYQPLVDLVGGGLVGVEALARWRHPTYGMISPDRFIGLAEDTGLIVPLGIHLLEQACRQAMAWTGPGAPFVSVNLASRQVRHPGLAADVMAVLDRTGLPAGRLQLEITESGLVTADDGVVATLRSLGDLGIRIAVDDFGTGYSSFAYLRTLPIHEIKLAAPFIRGFQEPGQPRARLADEAVLTALISLGHTLGLGVTAEGVETEEQARLLRSLGCDLAQGWLFGRPVPAEDIDPAGWLENDHAG